jgi:short-subunit dehydrogenase
MKLDGKRVLLTGATGGIGRHLALQMAAKGAQLALVCFDAERLQTLADEIAAAGGSAVEIIADFSHAHAAAGVVSAAQQRLGGIDILVNNAGILDFVPFPRQSPDRIAQMIQINVITPMQLARAALPDFMHKNSGQIVNIGSTFGSIGFPHYASYSASKFAMRGFSQALRRELADTGIKVTYVAPRAVRTPLNDTAAERMMEDANIAMDEPQEVAARIIEAIEQDRQELYIGWPESFFAWLNGFLPRLVDMGLKKQARFAQPYAERKFN